MKLANGRRWLLFAGANYYAAGGALDFKGCYLTKRRTLQALYELLDKPCAVSGEWAHVVDSRTGDIQAFRRADDGSPWMQQPEAIGGVS